MGKPTDTENTETAQALTTQSGSKSAGQIDYEKDLVLQPNYPDGTPRKTWDQLGELEQSSWHRRNKNYGCPEIRLSKRGEERFSRDLADGNIMSPFERYRYVDL